MAAAEGQEVLIVDADDSHGTLPLLFGTEAVHPFGRLRGNEVAAADLLVKLGHCLWLLPVGGDGRTDIPLEAAERRALMRRGATLYERFDLVIIDAGSRLEQVLAVASGSSRVLAVTAPERIAAAATYALVKVLDTSFPALPIELLFNRCRLSAATAAFDEVDGATRHFLERPLEFAGAVPEDDRLRAALEGGTPIQDAAGLGTPATAACHELSARLLSQLIGSDGRKQRRASDYSHAVLPPRLINRRKG
jgi:flagellar biosynthesis protein FlhG